MDLRAQNFSDIYLGNKIFSNYAANRNLNITFLDISTTDKSQLNNSILILNNNDFCSEACFHVVNSIKKKSVNLKVYIWDFDNHHSPNSIRLLFLSDIYFSAHQHNFDLFRRAATSFLGMLPACVHQWSGEFLTNSLERMLSFPRSNALFGAHIYYPIFFARNEIITSVSKVFPDVCFSNFSYHNRTAEDRFAEWCQYKVHFIAPVDDDLPIRLLDALITGGIPLAPFKLKALLHALSIDDFVVFYDELGLDLLHLKVEEAIIKFDQEGLEGMKKRFYFILENHHIDARINFLINFRH